MIFSAVKFLNYINLFTRIKLKQSKMLRRKFFYIYNEKKGILKRLVFVKIEFILFCCFNNLFPGAAHHSQADSDG